MPPAPGKPGHSPRTRTTEEAALGNLQDHQAQIMDMLGRDPNGADDLAWERAADLLLLSVHAVATVMRQRRIRREMPGSDPNLVRFAERFFGMGGVA